MHPGIGKFAFFIHIHTACSRVSGGAFFDFKAAGVSCLPWGREHWRLERQG